MLSLACVSWAAPLPPPGAPSWWNEQGNYYAYAQWLFPSGTNVSPMPGHTSWFSSDEFVNTDFKASIVGNNIFIDLKNIENEELYKQIFILVQGTSAVEVPTVSNETLDVDGQNFIGDRIFSSSTNFNWAYTLIGEIHHQPEFVRLSFDVEGLTGVTNIWAGENCIPEPTTICLLGIGALSLIRRKK